MKESFLSIILALQLFPGAMGQAPRQVRIDSIKSVLKGQEGADAAKSYAELASLTMQTDLQTGELFGLRALSHATAAGDEDAHAIALFALADVADLRGNYRKALTLHKEAAGIRTKLDDHEQLGQSYNAIGRVHAHLRHPDSSLKYQLAALDMHEVAGNDRSRSTTLNDIGITVYSLGDLPRAIGYFQQSLAIDEALGNQEGIAYALSNIGSIHNLQGDTTKAIQSHQRALKIRRELGIELQVARSLNNLGNIYAANGDIKKAIPALKEATEIKRKMGLHVEVGQSLINLGSAYCTNNEPELAIRYLNQAYSILDSLNAASGLAQANLWLAESHFALKHYDQAYSNYKRYHALKDSLWKASKNNEVAEMLTQFETERKDWENDQLKQENVAERQKSNLLFLGLIAAAGLLLALLLIYRLKLLANRKLKRKDAEIQQINSQLAVEVEDRTAHLRVALDELDTFLYQAAHSLRSPLTKIKGLQSIVEIEKDPEALRTLNTQIQNSLDGMDALLKKLIQVNAIVHHTPTAKAVDIVAEVGKVLEQYRDADKIARIETVLPRGQIIHTDPFLFETMLHSLVENAFQFAEAPANGGPWIQVGIALPPSESVLRLYVRNHGPEIPESERGQLFDMFFRGSRHRAGAGLGLYVFQKALEKLGGRVEIDSSSTGVEFLVELEEMRPEMIKN